MAKFNPPVPDTQDAGDFIGRSRGVPGAFSPRQYPTPPESSATTGFKVAGEALTLGTKAVDEYYKGTIGDQVEKEIDAINVEIGVEGVATNLGQIDVGTGNIDAPTPPSLVEAARQIEDATTAFKTGNYPEMYYWARVQALTKALRARYPGYRDWIDNQVARHTGNTPANQLFSEMLRARKTKEDNYLRDTGRDLLMENIRKARIPREELPYWTSVANAGSFTEEHISRLADLAQSDVMIEKEADRASKQLDISAKVTDYNDRLGMQKAKEQVSAVWAPKVTTAARVLQQDMQTLINKYGTSENAFKAEEIIQLGQTINQTFDQLSTEITNDLVNRGITGDQFNELYNAAIKPFQIIKDSFFDKDLGALNMVKVHNEATAEASKANILKNYGWIKGFSSLKSLLGENFLNLMMTRNPEAFIGLDKELKDFSPDALIMSYAITSGFSINSETGQAYGSAPDEIHDLATSGVRPDLITVMKSLQDAGVLVGKDYSRGKAIIDLYSYYLAHPETPPGFMENLIANVYSETTEALFYDPSARVAGLTPLSDGAKLELFRTIFTQAHHDNIMKWERTWNKDVKARKNYEDLLELAAGHLDKGLTERINSEILTSRHFKIDYDVAKQEFILNKLGTERELGFEDSRNEAQRKWARQLSQDVTEERALSLVKDLNDVFKARQQVWRRKAETQGADPDDFVNRKMLQYIDIYRTNSDVRNPTAYETLQLGLNELIKQGGGYLRNLFSSEQATTIEKLGEQTSP